jgi:hypothetical protein
MIDMTGYLSNGGCEHRYVWMHLSAGGGCEGMIDHGCMRHLWGVRVMTHQALPAPASRHGKTSNKQEKKGSVVGQMA